MTDERKRAIALGFFDGVHLGHGALLSRVARVARSSGLVPAGFTFDVHPGSRITGAVTPLINSPSDRADLMRRLYGMEEVVVAHFDSMMRMDWRDFVTDYLIKEHNVAYIVAGHDFRFGYKGEGSPQGLQDLCARLGVGCDIIPKVELDGITVSSTYIRTLIAQGEMERARAFLGHPHVLTDRVAHGKRLGSALGFPTVNLRFPEGVLVPAFGVYATQVEFQDGTRRPAVTNVGVRPTVNDGGSVNVEGYILNFSGDLYGQTVRMEFYTRLRGERKFDTLEALRAEVLRNARQTGDFFREME